MIDYNRYMYTRNRITYINNIYILVNRILVNKINFTFEHMLNRLSEKFLDKSSSLKCIRDCLTLRERDKSFAGTKLFFRDAFTCTHAPAKPEFSE